MRIVHECPYPFYELGLIWLEIDMNNTWFVPTIIIPVGLALAFLCYVSALYVF